MTYAITWEQSGRGVVIRLEGQISVRELHEINQEIYSRRSPTPLSFQLWDFSRAIKAKKPRVTANDALNLAIEDGAATEHTQSMSIALVGSEEYFGGLGRLYGVFADVWAEKVRFEVFPDLERARAWIEVEEPP